MRARPLAVGLTVRRKVIEKIFLCEQPDFTACQWGPNLEKMERNHSELGKKNLQEMLRFHKQALRVGYWLGMPCRAHQEKGTNSSCKV